jgi:hypothetical protein
MYVKKGETPAVTNEDKPRRERRNNIKEDVTYAKKSDKNPEELPLESTGPVYKKKEEKTERNGDSLQYVAKNKSTKSEVEDKPERNGDRQQYVIKSKPAKKEEEAKPVEKAVEEPKVVDKVIEKVEKIDKVVEKVEKVVEKVEKAEVEKIAQEGKKEK